MSESEMRIINNKQRNTQLGIIFNSQSQFSIKMSETFEMVAKTLYGWKRSWPRSY